MSNLIQLSKSGDVAIITPRLADPFRPSQWRLVVRVHAALESYAKLQCGTTGVLVVGDEPLAVFEQTFFGDRAAVCALYFVGLLDNGLSSRWCDQIAVCNLVRNCGEEDKRMGFDFNRYLEVFNKNDDELLTREYFTEDVIIDGPDRTLHGRQAWLDLLKFNHRGVRETLHPIMVVRESDNMMLEANALFTPSIDRPDFLLAPLKAGQPLKMRFFASYRIRGNQIAHLTLGWWPPGLRSI